MTPASCVVMLPGLLCDEAVWQSQREALGEALGRASGDALADAECIVPDYGALDSITAMAEHVLAHVPGRRLLLIAHSMGGRVALEMARLAPDRLGRLALLDTGLGARPDGEVGRAEERSRRELLDLAQQRGMAEMGRRWAHGMVHPAQLETPLFESIIAMVERKSPAIYQAQMQALLARPDATEVFSQLRCPTLLMCGRQDSWSPLERHEQMHALLPSSELVVIEDSGHMTTMEQPEAVNAALLRWLRA